MGSVLVTRKGGLRTGQRYRGETRWGRSDPRDVSSWANISGLDPYLPHGRPNDFLTYPSLGVCVLRHYPVETEKSSMGVRGWYTVRVKPGTSMSSLVLFQDQENLEYKITPSVFYLFILYIMESKTRRTSRLISSTPPTPHSYPIPLRTVKFTPPVPVPH